MSICFCSSADRGVLGEYAVGVVFEASVGLRTRENVSEPAAPVGYEITDSRYRFDCNNQAENTKVYRTFKLFKSQIRVLV